MQKGEDNVQDDNEDASVRSEVRTSEGFSEAVQRHHITVSIFLVLDYRLREESTPEDAHHAALKSIELARLNAKHSIRFRPLIRFFLAELLSTSPLGQHTRKGGRTRTETSSFRERNVNFGSVTSGT